MRCPLSLATVGVLAALAVTAAPTTAASAEPSGGSAAPTLTYEHRLDRHPSRDPHMVAASSNEVQAVWVRTLHDRWSIRTKRHAPNAHWGQARELDSFPAPRDTSTDPALSVVPGGPKAMVASWLHGNRIMLSTRPGGGDSRWGPAEAVTGPRTRALTPYLYVNPRTGQEAISFHVRPPGQTGSVLKVAVRRDGAWFVSTVGKTGTCAAATESRSDVVVDDAGNATVAYQDFRHCHDVRPTAARLPADATAWEAPHTFGRYGDLGTGSDPHLFVDPSGLVTLEVARTQFSRVDDQTWVQDEDPGPYGGDCTRCHPDVQRNDTGDMAYADATSLSVRPAGERWRSVDVPGGVLGIDLRDDGTVAVVVTQRRPGGTRLMRMFGTVVGTFGEPERLLRDPGRVRIRRLSEAAGTIVLPGTVGSAVWTEVVDGVAHARSASFYEPGR